jgi:hypothetical protein
VYISKNYYRTKKEFFRCVDDIRTSRSSQPQKVVRYPYRELYTSGKSGKSAREYAEVVVPYH